ncbi:formyl transferase [Streptomyces sp. TLI_171]|uniref:formyl transferase n=1 Tax=Streptomyces sp. TLI_171 TaxID=1938859 RepID=UPI000C1A8271|nr:formyl transferase [Streptomyces sp. TLI_171]RKE22531.1 formyl transferase-like protein [Streptomyces sp. TLI_171]
MRITVCTKRDLPGCVALNHLLPGLAGHRVQVLTSGPARPDEDRAPELAALRRFERDLPDRVVFPALDRLAEPPGRLLTFHHLGRRHGVECRPVEEINDGEGLRELTAFRPDLILAVRFGLILREAALAVPRLGALNVHPGELPRYAGLFAPFWTMLDGRATIGCTVHRIDRGVDTGPVLAAGRLPVDPARSLAWHVAHTYPVGIAALLRLLPGLLAGRPVPAVRQDRALRHYRSLPGPADLAAFRARGLRLVDQSDHHTLLGPFTAPADGPVGDGLPAPDGASGPGGV